ncbi:Bromodomain-containing protein, partial [Schizophyllum commune Tattone D]
MAKREHGQANGGRPAKRQRRYDDDGDVEMASGDEGGDAEFYGDAGGASVQEQGLQLWQTARDAVNKEGRLLSGQFLQKPSRKIYPDYYNFIQRPIAFDDIRKKLDRNAYPTLEAVREDFELCFTNAKTYNLKGSEIYNDAKDLLKLVNKTAARLAGVDPHEKKKDKPPTLHKLLKSRLQKLIDKTDDSGRILSTEFMELPSKKVWPIYYKVIKKPECLEAIRKRVKDKVYTNAADFAADVERVFSNAMEFNREGFVIYEDARTLRDYFHQLMSDMPPPFNLPQYSQAPTGAPKIKLKLGKAAAEQEAPAASSSHLTLRVPAPHAPDTPAKPAAPEPTLPVAPVTATKTATPTVPAANPPPPKAEPKSAAAPTVTTSTVAPIPATPVAPRPSPLVHTFSAVPQSSTASPLTPSVSSPSLENVQKGVRPGRTATPRATPKVQQPKPQQARVPTVPQPRSTTSTPKFEPFVQQYTAPTFSYYSGYNASTPGSSHPLPPVPHVSAPAPAPVPPPIIAAVTPAKTPDPPPLDPSRQIRSILMRTQPRGRCIILDHREGVKSWAIRLGPNERALHFSGLRFMGQEEEEEESSEEEEEGDEEEDQEILKRRPRGRPSKAAAAALKAAQDRVDRRARKRARTTREIFVKLNGTVVPEKVKAPEMNGGGAHRSHFEAKEWTMDLKNGLSTIEIGEKEGMIWKVYVDRPKLG